MKTRPCIIVMRKPGEDWEAVAFNPEDPEEWVKVLKKNNPGYEVEIMVGCVESRLRKARLDYIAEDGKMIYFNTHDEFMDWIQGRGEGHEREKDTT